MSKKQLIMETAIQLFAEKGIDATSVQQITDTCGISKGAFYLSFKSKDELIVSIIDYFMKKITSQIDHTVNNNSDPEDKLYHYYYQSFFLMEQHFDLAIVFMKEQSQTVNETILEIINHYEMMMNQLLHSMLLQLYPKSEQHIYDLIIVVNGLIAGYVQHFFKKSLGDQFDLHLLATSLVEKTNILAEHMKKPYFTKEMYALQQDKRIAITKNDILKEADTLRSYINDELILDSISITLEQLEQTNPHKTIVAGMLANLQADPVCSWFCYLVRKYLDEKKQSL
ncbi:TetR/AcrR family transcriptional regulator [Solibacillus sp. CAU 1738]|uniref:TetR/AcrR family transcriptional regulator n=1 Tax=Solibacillus sp. CAU 1738 TaxID=3140363 RepID=UPI0032606953